MAYAQTGIVGIDTPLGEDVVVLTGLSGREEMSRPYVLRLGLASEKEDIRPKDLVGKPVSIRLGREAAEPTYLHGIVRSLSYCGMHARRHRAFRAEVVPWLWFLTQNENCRIFQQKSAKQIVEQVFSDLGFADFEMSLKRTPAQRGYCVQYRESDFDFVSRLMEEEGIYYYFRHEKDRHVMVMADSPTGYAKSAAAPVEFSEAWIPAPHVSRWEHRYEFASGAFAHTDFNFETPSANLLARTTSVLDLPGIEKYEVYEWPGAYGRKADGDALARIRMEEVEAGHSRIEGDGTCGGFHPGVKFELTNHPWEKTAAGKGFVVVAVEHETTDRDETGVAGSLLYSNTFACLPEDVVYRPPRVTRKPVVPGCQTAIVVGPDGEELHTDEYGRVKVKFHWDRDPEKQDESSCWIRVAQFLAGSNWGAHFHPRVGQEVVVEFLDGDPDRPLVTGRVYNATQMPPYDLPANQTQSGIKSRSTKEGSAENFNEIRFEDRKGSEEIFVHAERNHTRIVENDDVLKVGEPKKDKGNQTIEIWNDRTETVKNGKETVTIEGGDRLVTIKKGKETLDVQQGDRTVTVGKGNDLLQVKTGNRTLQVDTGNSEHKIAKGNRDVKIDMGNDSLTIKMGDQTTKLDLGKSSTEAMQSIEFKVGANSVKIDQTGVTIKGIVVTIEGEAMVKAKAPMVQVSADAMLQLKGGITMIG